MALKNYRVDYADGSTQYFQFDEEDETSGGAAGIEAFKTAEKNSDSPVAKIAPGDPPSVNTPEELAAQAGGEKAKASK